MTLSDALSRERKAETERQQEALVHEARAIASGRYLHTTSETVPVSPAVLLMQQKNWEEESLYSLSEIKAVAIRYNLRFLPARLYRNTLPYPAHLKCSALEIELGTEPELYMLSDRNNFRNSYAEGEHLLFVQTGHEKFALLTSWGKPYPRTRLIRNYPFRSFRHIALFTLAVALLAMLLTPSDLINRHSGEPYWSMLRVAYYFHMVILFGAMATYYVVALRRSLNDDAWNQADLR